MDRENNLRKDEMNISLALPFVLILINHIDLMITVIISRINIKIRLGPTMNYVN